MITKWHRRAARADGLHAKNRSLEEAKGEVFRSRLADRAQRG
jgi:hypothetical protein